ncbi:DUF1521 domain-containing protein [Sphingomonas sp. DT-51]|uniref:DUF1521 domain-containing protein n=1 Tax=Sphingomonas sp. DT-51 TaxID=3396165 RepID=UPI003F1DA87C
MSVDGASIGFGTALGASASMLGSAAQLQAAAGLLVKQADPLGAGPFAQAMMPLAVTISAIAAGRAEPMAQWSATTTGAHTANVDLGDGYSLRIDERNSEMTILNVKTGETTRVWGDPHVEVDGRHAFDFWGTTTFQLENGAKITINTERYAGNPNMYVASQVVVTKGANSVVIDGISQNRLGDLSVSVGANGRALDAAHRDGFMLYENATGSGWRAEHGAVANQKDLDATRPGEAYGPGSTTPSLGEIMGLAGRFLTFGALHMGSLDAGRDQARRTQAFQRLL